MKLLCGFGQNPTENHQNHGRVTLLSRSICQQIGEDIGEIEITED